MSTYIETQPFIFMDVKKLCFEVVKKNMFYFLKSFWDIDSITIADELASNEAV